MKPTFMIVLLMAIALSGLCLAGEPTHGIDHSGEPLSLIMEGRGDFMEGWNEDQEVWGTGTYGAYCYAYPYSPSSTYTLSRIEFIGGMIAGPARFEVRVDDGTENPDGEVLGSCDFNLVEEIGWQGADLDIPVAVTEGMDYFIFYYTVPGSTGSLAVSGELITHYYNYECDVWEGPSTGFYWMAKFYGTGPVASSETSWDGIKALYR